MPYYNRFNVLCNGKKGGWLSLYTMNIMLKSQRDRSKEFIHYRKWNKRLARIFDSFYRNKKIEFQEWILEKQRDRQKWKEIESEKYKVQRNLSE